MKLALLGTGLMGYPMAEKLLEAGYQLIVYNRTIEKARPLSEKGARVAETPGEAIEAADVILLMVTDATAIEAMLFSGKETINFHQKLIVQMGTILREESLRFAQQITERGGSYVEAPVLGSIPDVKAGKLITMVSAAQKELFEQLSPIFEAFSSDIHWVGEVGKAAVLKLALNQLIASLTAAFSLSLGLVREYNIDPDLFMGILRKSALYAPTFDKKLPRMLERNFENPNFPAKHLLKDVNLIAAEAQSAGLNTALVDAVREILKVTLKAGYGEGDYSVLYNAIHPPRE